MYVYLCVCMCAYVFVVAFQQREKRDGKKETKYKNKKAICSDGCVVREDGGIKAR